jgi:benzoylformate decarboxylase
MMRTTAKQALMEILRAEGVEYVFGIPGATEIHFMDAVEAAEDIRYVLGLQEVVCAGMAEGYARASGSPGVLNLHTAPGLAAATPLLYNAQLGRVPLVVTVGQNDSRLLQRDPHLSGDIVGIGKIFAKWSTEVTHPEDVPVAMGRAFKMALQPPTGPVVVSLPQDVLQREFDFTAAAPTPLYTRLRADPAALRAALDILADADNPLLLVESGIARSGALAEIVDLAELVGARVYQNWMADVNFPVGHPQYLGDLDLITPQAHEALTAADVLVGVGCSLFAEGFFDPDAPALSHLKIIHIDDDPWELGKNLPTRCAIQGDIKSVLAELNEALRETLAVHGGSPGAHPVAAGAAGGSPFAAGLARAAQRRAAIAREKKAMDAGVEARTAAEKDLTPISISRLMTEIAAVATPNTLVVDECWSSSGTLRHILQPSVPGTYFRSRKGGSIGWGIPGALGVQLGAPDKQVLAVVGDGGGAWSMQGLWTAARYRIPVTFVITNNATYGQVKLVRRVVLGDYPLDEKHEGMELDTPVMDFSLLARSLGVRSERLSDPDRLRSALREALASGEPRLIEALVRPPS